MKRLRSVLCVLLAGLFLFALISCGENPAPDAGSSLPEPALSEQVSGEPSSCTSIIPIPSFGDESEEVSESGDQVFQI